MMVVTRMEAVESGEDRSKPRSLGIIVNTEIAFKVERLVLIVIMMGFQVKLKALCLTLFCLYLGSLVLQP